MHGLYAIRQNLKPLPSLLPQLPPSQHQQQQLDPVYENKIANFKQPQKITKNLHVTQIVGVIVPKQTYQLNSDKYNNNNNEVRKQNICRFSFYFCFFFDFNSVKIDI